jgi:NTP pyrophosphatase (non-canonical NTP hydrolase)
MDDSLSSLKDAVVAFRDARDWARFHRPKDLALGLVAEAGELAEVLLWKSDDELAAPREEGPLRTRLGDEMADVLTFLLYLAEASGTDLGDALRRKLEANAAKYPVDRARGSAAKYSEL